MIAQLVEVRDKRDGNDLLVARLQIEQPEISAALRRRCARHQCDAAAMSKLLLMALLSQIVAVLIHREDIHHAIAIGEEVDAPVPEHGLVDVPPSLL